MVEFDFEVSFYFINSSFVYALRTGGLGSEQQRWQLSPYTQDQNAETWQQDMEFAASFNAWNGRSRGVVRVDGVRESKTKKPVTQVSKLRKASCVATESNVYLNCIYLNHAHWEEKERKIKRQKILNSLERTSL